MVLTEPAPNSCRGPYPLAACGISYYEAGRDGSRKTGNGKRVAQSPDAATQPAANARPDAVPGGNAQQARAPKLFRQARCPALCYHPPVHGTVYREHRLSATEPGRKARPRSKPMATRKRAPAKRSPPRGRAVRFAWQPALIVSIEVAALTGAALIMIIAALGRTAERFAGTGLMSSLLPFAAMVLGLALATAIGLKGWRLARARLLTLKPYLPAVAACLLAAWAGWFASRDAFYHQLTNFRTLVGGPAEAERTTIAHQVFAAYRRADLYQYQLMWDRARTFIPHIQDAAKVYGIDEDVLVGVGATESSFRPRDSKDGGRGLFQITAPPKSALAEARQHLDTSAVDLRDHRHNTFVAAATLSHYLEEMKGDLFLGLLAYNIGPRNGGLLSIMTQYHARDFVTIQPYLQHLPRDYPVRVLTAALAYRLWRTEGKLPKYEEGNNASHIQKVGIPGLG